MQFNSYFFVLFFLPLTLLGYYFLGRIGKEKLSKVYLLLMSLWFYGYFNLSYLGIICGSIVVNFLFSRVMERRKDAGTDPKPFLILGICFNVAVIFYFKYFDFFISNINTVFGSDFAMRNILLPLGISFFTFQQISFMVDSYKGETKGYSFLDYALFVAFFPQLVAGPIVLHSELIPQFRDSSRHRVNFDNLSRGIILFTRGLGKKILIADTFGRAVDWGFSWAAIASSGQDALSFYEVIIVMLSYTFQIYFDFSGYSDMAIGLGAMFNLEIPVNFNSPYKALSISDFWKRWHMTLTRFLTRYIYIPLGGNRKGKVRTYINVMTVFLVSGIWHGANWTFAIWGGVNGLILIVEKLLHIKKEKHSRAERIIGWLYTWIFINLAWVFFRAQTLDDALHILKRIFADLIPTLYGLVTAHIGIFEIIPSRGRFLWTLGLSLTGIFCVWAYSFYETRKGQFEVCVGQWNPVARWTLYLFLLGVALCFGAMGSKGQFIYFRF